MSRGRKSKYDNSSYTTNKDKWIAALYVRLSVEDGDKDVSTSIESQKQLLDEFLNNNKDIQFYNYYIDDGYSGTDFNRPGFKNLFNDMKLNKFNTIIVKDLSRLGRNYIEAGNYIEQIFPLFNIRFIAINDKIDSFLFPESIRNTNMPLKNLINDEYCRDISKKISSTFKTMRKNGLYTSGTPPYGYKVDPENKHHLVIDEKTAPNVKLIYDLYLKGYGMKRIVNYLHDANIVNPSGYKKSKRKDINKIGFFWSTSSISKILDNQVYCGDLVQGKSRNISYKIHKGIKKPKEEWDIVKNTHEPIIDRDIWEKVQEIRKKATKEFVKIPKEENLFSGKLKCHECGYALRRMYMKNRIGYNCSTYMDRSNKICKNHYISEEELKRIVWKSIKCQLKIILNAEKVIKSIEKSKFTNDEMIFYKNNINKQQIELEKYKQMKIDLYEDWKLGSITEEEYKSYLEDYADKINNLSKNIDYLQQKINENKNKNNFENNNLIQIANLYRNKEKLSHEIVDNLIEVIEINKNKEIIIKFKYKDEFEEVLNKLKNDRNKLSQKEVNYV